MRIGVALSQYALRITNFLISNFAVRVSAVHTVSSVVVVVAYGALLSFVAVRARAAREFSEFSLAKRALPLALVFGSLADCVRSAVAGRVERDDSPWEG